MSIIVENKDVYILKFPDAGYFVSEKETNWNWKFSKLMQNAKQFKTEASARNRGQMGLDRIKIFGRIELHSYEIIKCKLETTLTVT